MNEEDGRKAKEMKCLYVGLSMTQIAELPVKWRNAVLAFRRLSERKRRCDGKRKVKVKVTSLNVHMYA